MIIKTSTALCIAALCMTGGQAQLVAPDSNTLVANIDMKGIKALFIFTPVTKGTGAQVNINVTEGLNKTFALSPTKGFEYHVHVNPVGPGNDCAATGGHLDPSNVGAAKCIPTKPEKCQEGDLSGKHGELKATDSGAIKVEYMDHQLRFDGETTTIAKRSIVIHNNGTRVACGNIVPYGEARSQSTSGEPVTNLAEQSSENKKLTSGASGSRYEYGGVNGGHALVALGIVASWMMMM
ncbi:hypothetical protein BG000_003143 [Podila horticola]|nr:hypothetical protein BG000_003143 [Podila horticola]